MPGGDEQKTKYVKDGSLANGVYYDLNQWRSGENKAYDGHIAEARVMEGGTALVGAFSQSSTLYRKGGVRVEATNSHVDDFTNNLVTIRAECRMGLETRVPGAVLSGAITAV